MVNNSAYNEDILQDLLPVYYKRLFPHKQFYRWLSYGNTEVSIFSRREISFTLSGDVYIRFQSYDTQQDFEKDICRRVPIKIDIGPVFTLSPKHNRMAKNNEPEQHEVVFDIDLTDYDNVRRCCKDAQVCLKCWKFMTIACRILDTALREDFAFEHILWVFSGRRGVHCWVCDETARHLGDKGRTAVAEYLYQTLLYCDIGDGKTGENLKSFPRVTIGDRMHHSVRRALKVVESHFEEICLVDQDLFGDEEGVKKLIYAIPDENLRKEFETYMKNIGTSSSSKEVWEMFLRFINSQRSNNKLPRKMKNIVEEIQLGIMYPKLDINVSRAMNHLLKAPFCVHPKTGKVCTTFNPNAAAKFDPTTVPTISMLLEEINAFDDKSRADDAEEDKRIKDYKKTGMFKAVVVFEEFLRKLENSFKGKAIETSDTKMDF